VVNVPDMETALDFYTKGLSFQVRLTRRVWGLGFFGRRSVIDGLTHPPPPIYTTIRILKKHTQQGDVPLLDPGTAIAYLQLAVPNLRISKLLGATLFFSRCHVLAAHT
jgi:hypothetical protein